VLLLSVVTTGWPTLPNADLAQVSEAKLRDYVLNPAHPQGGPKARVFAAVLGITRTDWQYLRRQLWPVDVCAQQPVGARLIEHDAIELALRVLLKRTNPLTADAQPADLEVVRSSYDRVADNYVAMGVGELAPTPWLRAALAAFAEDVNGLGPVLDVGCGPGTVTAHLAGLGIEVCGVDLSPRMIAHARRLHPGLRFSVASATDLRLADASLGGVLGWWSLFKLPRDVLPGVLVSFARALVPGGQVLVGTHVGDADRDGVDLAVDRGFNLGVWVRAEVDRPRRVVWRALG